MTAQEARDLMFQVFQAVWNPLYPVAWDDVSSEVPATDTPWARVTLKHATGRQASLSGVTGTQRFRQTGTIHIQIFSPVGQGKSEAYQLAQTVVNAYRDARLDVWFRNARLNEVGASGAFEQVNVLTDFSYDDVR